MVDPWNLRHEDRVYMSDVFEHLYNLGRKIYLDDGMRLAFQLKERSYRNIARLSENPLWVMVDKDDGKGAQLTIVDLMFENMEEVGKPVEIRFEPDSRPLIYNDFKKEELVYLGKFNVLSDIIGLVAMNLKGETVKTSYGLLKTMDLEMADKEAWEYLLMSPFPKQDVRERNKRAGREAMENAISLQKKFILQNPDIPVKKLPPEPDLSL